MPVRGASLVVLGRGGTGRSGREYVEATQAPYEEEGVEAFRRRVGAVAEGMAGAVFEASVGSHCLDQYRHGVCRVHVVRAVTS